MGPSKKKPTKAEKLRLDAIHCLPCIACAHEIEEAAKRGERLTQPFQTEADHSVKNGYRKHSGGHMNTISTEAWHHRGVCLDGHTASQMTAKYGPSKALDKQAFHDRYGAWDCLLAETDALLLSNTEFP